MRFVPHSRLIIYRSDNSIAVASIGNILAGSDAAINIDALIDDQESAKGLRDIRRSAGSVAPDLAPRIVRKKVVIQLGGAIPERPSRIAVRTSGAEVDAERAGDRHQQRAMDLDTACRGRGLGRRRIVASETDAGCGGRATAQREGGAGRFRRRWRQEGQTEKRRDRSMEKAQPHGLPVIRQRSGPIRGKVRRGST
jgi:hypothetical protein